MPTTRSQGRHEPLQRLETPPKRPRKQNPRRPLLVARGISQRLRMRKNSLSSDPEETLKHSSGPIVSSIFSCSYCDASTQTEDVIILTHKQAADLRDRTTASMSQKRTHDDESEDEPVAKRHQFSTPQNNRPNNLWMFGEKANGDYPRTAPSKPLAASSIRRPMRGPLSKRINVGDSPRHRNRLGSTTDRHVTFDSMKPIEQEVKKQDIVRATTELQKIDAANSSVSQTMSALQTPRKSIFGSLRGMVNKGWDIASSLTPLSARTESRSNNTAALPEPARVNYPQIQASVEDETSVKTTSASFDESLQGLRPIRKSLPMDPKYRSSRYEHLHYIPADADSVDRAVTGELEPVQRASPPQSPASRVKAQNPQLSDATIESILKKRERKAALEEEKYGRKANEELSQAAPLFGPDSHYARGTVDPRFLPPTHLHGSSQKRKLDSVNGEIPRPKSGGFGIDVDYLDTDAEIDDVDQPFEPEQDLDGTPPPKRPRTMDTIPNAASAVPSTPRSALKKPGITASIGRKSVAFGSSISRDIRGHYGPAGQYKGSTFADELLDDSRSPSSIDMTDVISPTTRINTLSNSGKRPSSIRDNIGASVPAIDFTLRDPNDQSWRPSLGNPRPGVFRVPDIDEEDPDESMVDITPEQPQTPRMSHAELPGSANTNGSTLTTDNGAASESTEHELDKARSRAEKYKPKSSSRLSEVSQARSRSTSPDAEGAEEDEQLLTQPPTTALAVSDASHVSQLIGMPRQPFVPRELDNTVKGADGLTDHEREHQYDDWAASLDWDAPQTYEDAGTGSAFIHNLIRKNWTDEDSKRSELFWAREFDEVDRAMEEAKHQGQRLFLVTGMEDIESY